MKIIRYLDPQGIVGFAHIDDDGAAYVVAKNEDKLEVTDVKAEVRVLLSPIEARTIYCVGLNYRDHAKEMESEIPEHPMIFMKSISALNAPRQPIILPRSLRSDKVDYEGELAVIIGKQCKNVPKENALDYVSGYTCANDVSARDWQKEWGGGQYCRGKTFDTFCPIGPFIVTPDEIPDPSNLSIKTYLNDEVVQNSNTKEFIFDIPTLIEFLSGSTTLLPGTVILTGTPSGVGAGRDPQRFLQAGDNVKVEIEKIGVLENIVEEEEVVRK